MSVTTTGSRTAASMRRRAGSALDRWADLAVMIQMLLMGFVRRERAMSHTERDDLVGRAYDQMMTFNRLVIGGVTLAVGILVYNQVISALPNSGGGAINQSNVTNTVESAFQLAPVALIVIVAGLILANVMGFGSGN